MRSTIAVIAVFFAFFLPLAEAKDLFEFGEDGFIDLPTHDDFPVQDINAVAQDSTGYIWIGAQNGLFRFDGYKYKHLKHNPDESSTIPDGPVYSLLSVDNGKLWISTSSGLSVLDLQTEAFISYRHDPSNSASISSNKIISAFAGTDGGIWIATPSGLDYLGENSHQFEHFKHDPNDPSSISSNQILSFAYDRDRNLLVGTKQGLNRLTVGTGKFEQLVSGPSGEPLANQQIHAILTAEDGKIWIGTLRNGFAWIGTDGRLHRPIQDDNVLSSSLLSKSEIRSIIQASENEIWLSSYGHGVFVVDAKSGQWLRTNTADPAIDTSLNSNYVHAMMKDKSGMIWLAHTDSHGGINLHNANNRSMRNIYNLKNSTAGAYLDKINVIVESADGGFWLGGKGLNLLSAIDAKIVSPGATLGNIDEVSRSQHQITSLTETSDGMLWILMSDFGVIAYNRATDRATSYPQHLFRTKESSLMAVTDNGTIWVYGTDNPTLTSYNTKTNELNLYPLDKTGKIKYSEGKALIIDHQNTVWVATEHGLFYHSDSTHQPGVDGLQASNIVGTNVNNLLLDSQNNLWVATRTALYRHAIKVLPPVFESISDIANLPEDAEFGRHLQHDQSGWIWGTNGVLDPHTLKYHPYQAADGIDLDRSWQGASTLSHDNTLIFGGFNGIMMIKPERFEPWSYAPNVVFSEVFVNGNRMAGQIQEISVPSDTANLAFEVTALDYSAPLENRYAYKLEGFSEYWIDTTAEHRHITYSNLPPGEYVLKIRGSNRTGRFSPHESNIAIKVLPIWYQTWWFKLIALSLLLSAILLFFRYRVKQLEINRQRLAIQVKEGTKELRRRNDDLEQKAHELDQNTTALEVKQAALNKNKTTLEEKSEEITNTLAELVSTQEKLIAQEKLASLGELVSGLAHEINTPLGISVTAASHLQDQTNILVGSYHGGTLTPTSLKKYLTTVEETTDLLNTNLTRSANLIQSFKKVSVNQTHDELSDLNVAECLDQIMTSLSPTVDPHGHLVELNCDPTITMRSYPGVLSQLLTNMVMNSIDHAFDDGQPGKISIDVREGKKEQIHLNYTDNGKGIPQEYIKKIFDPFFTTNRGAGGTGLGLSIAFNLVTRKLGGKITCESELNKFTCFELTLPKYVEEPTITVATEATVSTPEDNIVLF